MLINYLPILGLFTVGIISIYNDRFKEKYGKKFNVLLIGFLIISTGWSLYIQHTTNSQLVSEASAKRKDSAEMQHHFDTIISGLKADTTKLNRTNKLLADTRDTLSNRLSKSSIKISDKILKSGNILLGNLKELNNQITGGDSYLYFGWQINGQHRDYNAILGNTSKYRLELLQMQVTDYDQLLGCKQENTNLKYKIDKACWNKNTRFIPDTNSIQNSLEISPSGMTFMDYSMPKVLGVHRYEILFVLRSITYYEQLIYQVNNDFSIFQASRLIKADGKHIKVLYFHLSNSKEFNNNINWDKFFPITYNERLYYNF